MQTREEAVAAAQEAADRTGRSTFVYPLLGSFAYGSGSWVDGMDQRPADLLEIKPYEEVLVIAQIEANRVGRSQCVYKHAGVWMIRQSSICGGTLVVPSSEENLHVSDNC